jgi:hypothetical protein
VINNSGWRYRYEMIIAGNIYFICVQNPYVCVLNRYFSVVGCSPVSHMYCVCVCVSVCRTAINNMVIAAFNYTIINEYSASRTRWRLSIQQSKFVLCPSGLSMDSYRVIETLLLGSIPIVESNPPGLDRTYASLPVLIVKHFSVVTPAFLEKAYECFVKHAPLFQYEHLSRRYWFDLIDIVAKTGSLERIMENHPFRHRYCDFLGYNAE